MFRNKDKSGYKSEDDTDRDPHTARSRATGGVEDPDAPDQGSTTGTTPSGEFVGRIAGQDIGSIGETGAERRAAVAAGELNPDGSKLEGSQLDGPAEQ